MKPITTIFEQKTLEMWNALTPALREKITRRMTEVIHYTLADMLSKYTRCIDCPIGEYCSYHRDTSCLCVVYNYLEEDFDDDTNG